MTGILASLVWHIPPEGFLPLCQPSLCLWKGIPWHWKDREPGREYPGHWQPVWEVRLPRARGKSRPRAGMNVRKADFALGGESPRD